jgi:hypothetical protein
VNTLDSATPRQDRGAAPPTVVETYAAALGQAVEASWAAHGYHLGAFPDVATRCLSEVEVPRDLDAASILRAVATSRHLVTQEDPNAVFAQPPVTLWRSRDFFVSALFWLDGTPAIHQHDFCGAFRVLVGGSLHAPYTFSTRESITQRLVFGDLRMDGPELLGVGDVRAIEPGSQFIHGLFHLDRPSVTMVVRTYRQPTGQPQFQYFRPGVAFDPFFRDELLERRFQSVVTLADLDRDAGAAAACELIAGEDLWAGFLLAERWFDVVERGRGFEQLLDALVHRHGSTVDPLISSFDQQRRSYSITSRRRMLQNPEHRLFLALLLNLPDRRSVDTILGQRFPDSDPGTLLSQWVTELAAPDQLGVSGLALDGAELASLTQALRDGRTAALGAVELAGHTPAMLQDLFRT